MSLAQLLFPAPTPNGLEEWSHSLWQILKPIRSAIQAQYGIDIGEPQIYPVNFDDPASTQIFLRELQNQTNIIGSILGIQGNDLANVDFNDEDQRKSWHFLVVQFLRSATESLGGGIG